MNNERFVYNQMIVDKLQELIKKHPDLRFGQILVNTGIIELQINGDKLMGIDPFNEEPKITWARILKSKFCS